MFLICCSNGFPKVSSSYKILRGKQYNQKKKKKLRSHKLVHNFSFFNEHEHDAGRSIYTCMYQRKQTAKIQWPKYDEKNKKDSTGKSKLKEKKKKKPSSHYGYDAQMELPFGKEEHREKRWDRGK